MEIIRPSHEAVILIAYAQTPPLIAHPGVSSRTRYLIIGLRLRRLPFFVYAGSEDSGETARIRSLA